MEKSSFFLSVGPQCKIFKIVDFKFQIVVDHIDLTKIKKRKRPPEKEQTACSKCFKPLKKSEIQGRKRVKTRNKLRIIDKIDLTLPKRRSQRFLNTIGPEIDLTLDQDENANGALKDVEEVLPQHEKEENQTENNKTLLLPSNIEEDIVPAVDANDAEHTEKPTMRLSPKLQFKLKKKLINSVTNRKLLRSSNTIPRSFLKTKALNNDYETSIRGLRSSMKTAGQAQSVAKRKLLKSITNDLSLSTNEISEKLIKSHVTRNSKSEQEDINSEHLPKTVNDTQLQPLDDPIAEDQPEKINYKSFSPQNKETNSDFRRRKALRSSSQNDDTKEETVLLADLPVPEIKKGLLRDNV